MNAYVFATQASAQACESVVAASLGYPLIGVEVGGGNHVKDPVTGGAYETRVYFVPRQHPTLLTWAYIADANSAAALAPHATALGLPAPVALDATWFPAPSAVAVGP